MGWRGTASPAFPQGGILSPLLANVALSVLDDHFAEAWEAWGDFNARAYRRRKGLATYRLVRYADDLVVLVAGDRSHVEVVRDEVTEVLRPMGLRLSEPKTRIAHIDEGFDFLGFRIQRQRQRGSNKRFVYTWPSKKALASIKAKVRALSRGGTNHSLAVLLRRLNPVLRGWANYFKHGVSKGTFDDLNAFSWRRVICWLRHKHRHASWKRLRRRYLPGWRPTEGEVSLFKPCTVAVTPLPLSGSADPLAMAEDGGSRRLTRRRELVRTGCGASRTSGSEVRAGETDRPRGRHCAPAQSLLSRQGLVERP